MTIIYELHLKLNKILSLSVKNRYTLNDTISRGMQRIIRWGATLFRALNAPQVNSLAPQLFSDFYWGTKDFTWIAFKI